MQPVMRAFSQDRQIRLVIVLTGLTLGGAEMMLWKLLSRIDRSRFEPIVITVNDTTAMLEQFKEIGIHCRVLGMRSIFTVVGKFMRLARMLRELQPDIIQGWMYHGNVGATLGSLCVQPRPPVLWNVRGSLARLDQEKRQLAFTIWLGGKLSFLAARIINNSVVSAMQHEEDLGYSRAKRVILPNGFDTELFRPAPEARSELRAALGLRADAVLIGLVGRYHPMKDPLNFIRAAARLPPLFPDICFVLAGHHVDGSNRELVGLLRDNGLIEYTRLLGRRDDMHLVTAGLDILVSSSVAEGFPNVVGEAMSCGVPCVVTDVGDSAWVIGDTGFVVPARDPERLARAVQHLIEIGHSARTAMGARARARIVENFSLDVIVRQYEALYEQVWHDSHRARG